MTTTSRRSMLHNHHDSVELRRLKRSNIRFSESTANAEVVHVVMNAESPDVNMHRMMNCKRFTPYGECLQVPCPM